MKRCSKCETEKPLSEFYKRKTGSLDGLNGKCKSCFDSKVRRAGRKNWNLRKMYGITLNEYTLLLEKQNGKCAICKTVELISDKRGQRHLPVDHCHLTGRVRGILCHGCNTGLGSFKDDPAILKSAVQYLLASKSKENVG